MSYMKATLEVLYLEASNVKGRQSSVESNFQIWGFPFGAAYFVPSNKITLMC